MAPRRSRSPRATPLLALGALLLLPAAAPAAGWDTDPAADARWQRVQQAGFALAPSTAPLRARVAEAFGAAPPATSASPANTRASTHAAWQQEWRLIEARLLSLGTLPAEVTVQTGAAFREALASGSVPTRFAPDSPQLREEWMHAEKLSGGASPRASLLGAHARSGVVGWQGLSVWAEGAGYAVGRRSAGYGLECGAALSLDEGVDLTAGYRLAGYTLAAHLDMELDDVEERVGTPFVGLDFRF